MTDDEWRKIKARIDALGDRVQAIAYKEAVDAVTTGQSSVDDFATKMALINEIERLLDQLASDMRSTG